MFSTKPKGCSVIVELVHTTTRDGMRLDGALHRAANPAASTTSDVLLCLHGVGGNFYGSSLFHRISPTLLDAGVSLLWANTRGRDSIHTTQINGQPARRGAAYELVDDCRFDIAAWLSFLGSAGFEQPGMLGHSLGAIKALYSEATEPHPHTSCAIALSPPRLSFAMFNQGKQSAPFFTSISLAERSVQAGRPHELMEVSVPYPMLISAGSYLDKYGPEEKYNIVNFANRVRPPTLIIYGGQELSSGNPAFAGVPEALAALPDQGQRFTLATIAEADHNYSGKQRELAGELVNWLARA
jgi:hypothetical protein